MTGRVERRGEKLISYPDGDDDDAEERRVEERSARQRKGRITR